MTDIAKDRLRFWNERSGLGLAAGSGDTNLKHLEIRALLSCINNSKAILDAGCGSGHTLIEIAKSAPDCLLFGFDYSPGMVEASKDLIKSEGLMSRIATCEGSLGSISKEYLTDIGSPDDGFDCIYTERSLINLDSLSDQINAVHRLWELLSPGGQLLVCESFVEGLREINHFRASVGLSEIVQPWHNRYLSLTELDDLTPKDCNERSVIEFSGSYYFASRVINAQLARLSGSEPDYGSPINLESMKTAPLPVCGQSKLVVLRKP